MATKLTVEERKKRVAETIANSKLSPKEYAAKKKSSTSATPVIEKTVKTTTTTTTKKIEPKADYTGEPVAPIDDIERANQSRYDISTKVINIATPIVIIAVVATIGILGWEYFGNDLKKIFSKKMFANA